MEKMGEDSLPILSEAQREAFGQVFGEDYLTGFDDPVIFVDARLDSRGAQQFYKREFKALSRILYAEYIYRRKPGFDAAILDRFAKVCSSKLTEVEALIKAYKERTEALCKQNGKPTDAGYLRSGHMTVPVIHAVSAQYLRVVVLLDQLFQVVGSAVLHGVISSDQRKEAELKSRKAIKTYTVMVRNESIAVRKEARRLKEAPAGTATGADAVELDRAMQHLDGAIAALDEAGGNQDPAEASAELQDLVATATAAASATKRKNRASTPAPAPAPASAQAPAVILGELEASMTTEGDGG